ncbi:PQQ-dependent sugar dehydrogenase [Hyphococcus flavus]|uniref:PQQ-dependent sugar dehydrogenase n=1 Tax=Hyphococcus flavus TaxID=1866326 RepID=A0AAF0CI78_9PROT|nr:PQQ-dependent sugar dehydrogenase [Hyphococcus flavus]WDI32592.1 PQQ-dependent sugar dehydrogenase [Hyphococcus flavus]
MVDAGRKFLCACCVAALMSCSAGDGVASSSQAKGGGDAELQETLASPAPEGELALSVETLADGLVNPWSIAFLPDGSMLVSEREGRLRIIRDGELVDAPVAGVPEVLSYNQGGLHDVLPHPNFEENGLLYLAYAHGTEGSNATRVARARFDGQSLNDVEVLYDAKPLKDTGHHFGGRMVWGGDGKLYVSVGEGSRYKEKAQDMSSSFGAVLRLNEDGSIPADNPDFGEGALPELYSKGHRNPQGLAYDAERDILWEHEHGPRGGDEINIVEPGANYGWPLASYGIDYNGAKITPFTEYEGTRQPFKYWTPSIAPSGLAVYRGELFSDWNGDLLVGAMSSSSGEALHRVILDGNEEVGEERYLIGERIREVRVGPDGAIYVTTEERRGAPEGKVLRVTPQ